MVLGLLTSGHVSVIASANGWDGDLTGDGTVSDVGRVRKPDTSVSVVENMDSLETGTTAAVCIPMVDVGLGTVVEPCVSVENDVKKQSMVAATAEEQQSVVAAATEDVITTPLK